MLADDVDSIVQTLCDAGAAALQRYVKVSGELTSSMPEYFLSCAVFDALAPGRAITLETPFWQIHEWQNQGAKIPDLSPGSESWKVDMVIYDGEGKPPHEQRILAFVEFKNGYIDADPVKNGRRADREKLLALGRYFSEERPHLICCGSLSEDLRVFHIAQAKEKRDRWFEAATGELPYENGKQFFCARLLTDLV